jgi:hypothetical protein
MRQFIIGFILGSLLTTSVAWAYSYARLQDAETGVAAGTDSNPIYIEVVP